MNGVIRNTAQNRGHSEILCQGMITLGIEVWLLRDRKTGELRLADGAREAGQGLKAPPTLAPILIYLGIFFAYMELNAPGQIVPGVIAACCFAIYFSSRYLVGLS